MMVSDTLRSSFLLIFLFFIHASARSSLTTGNTFALSRLDFPPDFIFGAGTSAYQVEGAAAEDGRKPSIWDTFTHDGKTVGKSTGDVASDQYHHYKDDVKLMHEMGIDAYRFSISWSRIIPDGYGAVNPKGVDYYNNLINELVSYGIQPHVTLSHFDVPQALEDEYQGYLSPKFIEDFTAYADVCFKEYGDRVKSWMTFNEPSIQTVMGYGTAFMPPGHCSYPFGVNCVKGDSTTEPYLAGHNILLSHAAVVHLYRTKYQEKQKGQIGITFLVNWFEPNTMSPLDIAATERALDFNIGWFLGPLVYGRYPDIMRKIVGSRLPTFTENEAKQLKGSFDFLGLNYYFVSYIQDLPRTSNINGSDYYKDISVILISPNEPPHTLSHMTKLLTMGLESLEHTHGQDFTRVKADGALTPGQGIQRLFEYVKVQYGNPVVVIHENGYSMRDDSADDSERVEALQNIIKSLLTPIRFKNQEKPKKKAKNQKTRKTKKFPEKSTYTVGGIQIHTGQYTFFFPSSISVRNQFKTRKQGTKTIVLREVNRAASILTSHFG